MPSPESTHDQHGRWAEELAAWLDATAEWQLTAGRGLVSLLEAQRRLEAHVDALVEHLEALGSQRRDVQAHEVALRQALETEGRDLLSAVHVEEASRQTALRQRHEALAQQHRALLAEVRRLVRAAE